MNRKRHEREQEANSSTGGSTGGAPARGEHQVQGTRPGWSTKAHLDGRLALVLQPGLLSNVPRAPSRQHCPVSGGFSDCSPSGNECCSPDGLGKSPATSRDGITATQGRVLQEPGEVRNRPQHHLGGTASPRLREASQAP